MDYITTSDPAILLDTAALAVHLECSASYVRLLVSKGIIDPVGRKALKRTGRPAMWFDVDAVESALRDASDAGRVTLDKRLKIVRKS
jgi:hypothetical protein